MAINHKLDHAATSKSNCIVVTGYADEKCHFLNASSAISGLDQTLIILAS